MLGKLIGVGGFSRVYDYISESYEDCWIKIIATDMKITQEKAYDIIFNEGMVMEMLGNHPNIVKLISAQPASTITLEGREYNASYLLLQKWVNGTLANIIKKTGPFEENIARFIFLQIWSAVKHIHSKGLAHLDIKLENILLDEYFNIKISDFGTTEYIDDCFGFISKEWGTKGYMAPEITSTDRDDNYDAYTADIYSLGVCLNLLLTGQFPPENQNMSKDSTTNSSNESIMEDLYFDKMMWRDDIKDPSIYNFLSDDVRILLDDMLDEDPWNRPSIFEVHNSDWIKQNFSDNIASIVFEEINSRAQFIESSKNYHFINF